MTLLHKTRSARPGYATKASQKKRRARRRKRAQDLVEQVENGGHNGAHEPASRAARRAHAVPGSGPAFLSSPLNDWRQPGEYIHFWVVTAIIFVTYLFTMPHTVTLEDSGLFNMVCYYAGVGHPPGYPIYTLMCVPFAHLPWLTTAHGLNIFSALCGALGCGFMYRTCQLLLANRAAAYAGGLACGLSSVFWSQAIIQEVYSPNALLVLATLWLCVLYFHSREPRHFYTLAFVYGLSLSNHWPLVGLSSVMFFLVVIPRWRDLVRLLLGRGLFISTGLLLLGLLPYAYVVWRSNQNPFINFYDPLDSFDRILHFLSRSGYSGVDDAGGTIDDKIHYFKWIGVQILTEYHWVATALMGVGFVWQWFRTRWNISLGVIAGVIGSSFLLTLLLHFTYNELWRSVFRVYPVVPYALQSVWLAFGVDAFARLVRLVHKTSSVVVALLLAVAAVGSTGYANIQENNRTDDRWGWQYGAAILNALEDDAILITWGDLHLPIMYAGTVAKIRPDIDIYNGQALIFSNRVTPALTSRENKNAGLRKMIANTKRPVYFFEDMGEDMPWGVENYGLVKKIRRDLKGGEVVYSTHPELLKLIPHMLDFDEPDAWTRRHKQSILKTQAHLVARILFSGHVSDELKEQTRLAWDLISRNYAGIMAVAFVVNAYPDINLEPEQLISLLEYAQTTIDMESLPLHEQAAYYNVLGTAYAQKQELLPKVVETLVKGVEVYPSFENESIGTLMQVYVQTDRLEEFDALDKRFPAVVGQSDTLRKLLRGKNWSWERQREAG